MRFRLTILFSIITAAILLAFAALIYLSAKDSREREFFALLKKEALTKANLYVNAEVDVKTLQDIYKNNRALLNEVEVAIYDTAFTLLYHDAVDIDFVKETPEMLTQILQEGEISFYQQDWQVLGFRYAFDDTTYLITAAAFDEYGYTKLSNLLRNMVVVFIISMLFIFLAGVYFSKRAFDPVREMTDKARKISATNLDLRLNSADTKGELSELANTFNEMLSRLEQSFDAQRDFVYHISHELRTPLSAIIAELELATKEDLKKSEYKTAIKNALSDAKKLVRLQNSLLDLAKASYDPVEIAFKPTRIDELLLDAMRQVLQANPSYRIDIIFDQEFDSDVELTVCGNEYLLKVAFANLFENGCKFSADQSCLASINIKAKVDETASNVNIAFVDKGVGIVEEDLPHIFSPFYRGQNRDYMDGNGIGLYLTHKIAQLHHGSISVESVPNQGTSFTVSLPIA